MPVRKLKDFMDKNKVKYVSISHSPAFTAQEIAESAAVPGMELAKTVIVKTDGQMAMAVLPASRHVNFGAMERELRVKCVELASEDEFKGRFPSCEIGAMPPFGNLYEMPVFVDSSLATDEHIAFNAGTHTELIRLAYGDFAKLVKPRVFEFAAQG